jgi:2-oxoisovalerate dehydrogenase E2 component (dihydrolipoyl transacylase)
VHRRARQYSPVDGGWREHDIDLSLARRQHRRRVTRQDVLRYVENPSVHTVAPAAGEGVVGFEKQREPAPPPAPAVASAGTAVPLTPTRRTIAQRMSESHRTIPVAWMVVEADVTGLVALRESAKEQFERIEGPKLTYMPFFVQAIVGALKEHVALNATFTDDGIVRHASCDAGVAIATDWGLVVPVICDAGGKSIAGLARELRILGDKARARKLSVEEMRGATFTIDNTGAFGSIMSQPIVRSGRPRSSPRRRSGGSCARSTAARSASVP